MKIFLAVMLVLHVLMEGLVGLVLMFSPETMAAGVGDIGLPYLIYYGGAGITMALVVAWLWPNRHHPLALGMALGIIASFHTALFVAGGLVVMTQGEGVHIIISHGVMALAFWLLWTRRGALARP